MSKTRIQFKTIRYKNFMAVGEQWIEVQLDANDKTIIYGKNGSGKSTLYEALFFCLFNKAFRKINKPDLVNNINNKGLCVEVTFDVGSTEYRVVRGIKPNIFEIYRDGEMLDQTSSTADYQNILETQILKMGPKGAGQTMILGSKLYVPFMKLSALDRREFSEELFDTKIFSEMNDVNKVYIKELKADIEAVEHDIELGETRIAGLKSHIIHVEETNKKEVEQSTKEIAELEESLEPKRMELERHTAEGMELRKKYDAIEDPDPVQIPDADLSAIPDADFSDIEDVDEEQRVKVERQLSEVRANLNTIIEERQNVQVDLGVQQKTITGDIERLNKDKDFYQNNPVCPTCKQSTNVIGEETITRIDTQIKSLCIAQAAAEELADRKMDQYDGVINQAKTIQENLEQQLRDFQTVSNAAAQERLKRSMEVENQRNELIREVERERAALKDKVDTQRRELMIQLNALRDKVQSIQNDITYRENQIKSLKERVERFEKAEDLTAKKAELKEASANLKTLKGDLKIHKADLKEYQVIQRLLKDDGIKQRIIKSYIPVINKLIRKYLDILGFQVGFTLDESFKETISVPGRRDLQYGSFSAGEQMRIDLALLFAFREIPIIKGGNTCNLMVFDEVADSALDVEGWDAFFTIIESITDISNVFVISPKGDELTNRFNHAIRFRKKGSFTHMDVE